MNKLNRVLLEGNLTRDPELTQTEKGTSVCHFSIAANRYYKQDDEQKQEVSYIDIETWSGLADNCNKYLTKGRGVRVFGRLKQDRWIDNTTGNNKQRMKIVAEHIEFKPQRIN